MQLLDSDSRPVPLGNLLAKRGEGSVYELPKHPRLLAKIYHAPTPERAAKLEAMVAAQSPSLSRLAAWPVQTVHVEKSAGAVGFLMPRIDEAEEVHVLYGPRSRKERFPSATWQFLVHTATNIARSFAAVHEHGHVIGDVNHGNLLVTQNATVALIDCDSFHLHLGGKLFPCAVGVSTHTPPELQDTNLARVDRTANHDAFGLAVMVFQLLFMGRHPFSGRFLGVGDMPIERAIKEYRFAYGAYAENRQMQPPPGTLPFAATPPAVSSLFERAFSQPKAGTLRPTAREWVLALEKLGRSLCVCAFNPGHQYASEADACPWCDIEATTNALLFYIPSGSVASLPSIKDLWAKIAAIAPPDPAPTLPRTRLVGYKPPPEIAEIAAKKRNLIAYTLNRRAIDEAVAQVEARYKDALAAWNAAEEEGRTDPGLNEFQVALSVARKKMRGYEELDTERLTLLNALVSDQETAQKDRYLDGFPLADGMIEGVGLTKIVTLNSYNIYSAKDIVPSRIRLAPGFGSALTTRLAEWRRNIESNFRFVPDREPDRRDIEQIENRIYTTKIKIAQSLGLVPAELQRIKGEIAARRVAVGEKVRALSSALAKAEANYNAVK